MEEESGGEESGVSGVGVECVEERESGVSGGEWSVWRRGRVERVEERESGLSGWYGKIMTIVKTKCDLEGGRRIVKG